MTVKHTLRQKIRFTAEDTWSFLTYWPGPGGFYKQQAWPEVNLTGKGTEEEPFALVVVRGEHTRGRDLFFHAVDWIDDHTGHKICGTRWFGRLMSSVYERQEEIGRIPITAEQAREINPDYWYLPEHQEDDDDEHTFTTADEAIEWLESDEEKKA